MTSTENDERPQGERSSEGLVRKDEIRRISTGSEARPAGTAGRTSGRDGEGRWVPGDQWDRFWAQVEVGPGCWLWQGRLTDDGYPVFKAKVAGQWRPVRAHRWAWALAKGPIPAGHTLDHLCHTADRECPGGPACLHRRCVRFDHLTPCTSAENVRLRHARARAQEETRTMPTTAAWRLEATRREQFWGDRGAGEVLVTYDEPRGTRDVTATPDELDAHVAQFKADTGADKVKVTRLDDGEGDR